MHPDAPDLTDRLADRLARFERMLGKLNLRARLASARSARGLSPGSFASRRPATRGFEPAPPRPFSLEDEPDRLEFGRIGVGFAVNPLWAAYNGELRTRQSTAYLESELVVVIDLSRSMLTGCRFTGDPEGNDLPSPSKLEALYLAVTALLAGGEAAGFVLRVLYAQGDRVAQERTRTARDFRTRALTAMSGHLLRTARSGLEGGGAVEPFSLAHGLAAARAVRIPGVVAVVSDFLDPTDPGERPAGSPSYTDVLADLLLRHDVILVDLASRHDLAFPVPRWFDVESSRLACTEGARHLELGTGPRTLPKAEVRLWNARREFDRRTLRRLVANNGGRLVAVDGWDYPKFQQLATAHLGATR